MEAIKCIFKKYGVTGCVFVSRMRNSRNFNFGFINIGGVISIHEAISRLNMVCIGIVRLKAFKVIYFASRNEEARRRVRITVLK